METTSTSLRGGAFLFYASLWTSYIAVTSSRGRTSSLWKRKKTMLAKTRTVYVRSVGAPWTTSDFELTAAPSIFPFSGTYDISVSVDGKDKLIGNYDNQGSFGELALMYNMPRAATIQVGRKGPDSLPCTGARSLSSPSRPRAKAPCGLSTDPRLGKSCYEPHFRRGKCTRTSSSRCTCCRRSR